MDVSFAVVFGSHVNGTPDQWSDIDLVVVSSLFDPPMDNAHVDELWHAAARTDNRIEPIPCGEHRWETDDSSPIIETARREGVRIDAN